MTARTGKDPGELYGELEEKFGKAFTGGSMSLLRRRRSQEIIP
jgi:hypothetical protein